MEFRFRTFRVTVPQSVLTKWAATSVDETCKIIESVTALYTSAKAEWRQAKDKPTLEGIRALFECFPAKGDSLAKTIEKLENRELKKRVLWLLRFERYRALNRPPIAKLFRQALLMAAADGDEKFFKALGERLKGKAIPFEAPAESTALKKFLIEHWIVRQGICFCWFSDRALVDFLKQTVLSVSLDSVRKTRQRLRLRKLRRPLIRTVTLNATRIVLS